MSKLPPHWKIQKLIDAAIQVYPSLSSYGTKEIEEFFNHFAELCFKTGQTEATKPVIPVVDYSFIPEVSLFHSQRVKIFN